jgi:hypothetical protein
MESHGSSEKTLFGEGLTADHGTPQVARLQILETCRFWPFQFVVGVKAREGAHPISG